MTNPEENPPDEQLYSTQVAKMGAKELQKLTKENLATRIDKWLYIFHEKMNKMDLEINELKKENERLKEKKESQI